MSHFIASMFGGRLDRDAAGVEGHALADEGDRRVALARRRSSCSTSSCGSRTEPCATPSSAPMPSLAIVGAVEHLELEARGPRRSP